MAEEEDDDVPLPAYERPSAQTIESLAMLARCSRPRPSRPSCSCERCRRRRRDFLAYSSTIPSPSAQSLSQRL